MRHEQFDPCLTHDETGVLGSSQELLLPPRTAGRREKYYNFHIRVPTSDRFNIFKRLYSAFIRVRGEMDHFPKLPARLVELKNLLALPKFYRHLKKSTITELA